MSSASACSLEIPSVRQWKAKISFPCADPPGLVAREQGACAFLISIRILANMTFPVVMELRKLFCVGSLVYNFFCSFFCGQIKRVANYQRASSHGIEAAV
ncbi:hypothetical protein [Alteribacillus sp. YIM 98480]|uniref:hypothetical protein n=1 Tax=Alteribacillus sp. YIM 98480 TaxID=2606599 RepID=UPI00131B7031|nr:hypothetical protein [Alteribacillus sp. YIM 98480]